MIGKVKAAKRRATQQVREKLDAYQSARSEAERRADEYRVELEALRALPPELRGVADDAEAGNAEEANVQSPYAPRTRKTVVGAAKLSSRHSACTASSHE